MPDNKARQRNYRGNTDSRRKLEQKRGARGSPEQNVDRIRGERKRISLNETRPAVEQGGGGD